MLHETEPEFLDALRKAAKGPGGFHKSVGVEILAPIPRLIEAFERIARRADVRLRLRYGESRPENPRMSMNGGVSILATLPIYRVSYGVPFIKRLLISYFRDGGTPEALAKRE